MPVDECVCFHHVDRLRQLLQEAEAEAGACASAIAVCENDNVG